MSIPYRSPQKGYKVTTPYDLQPHNAIMKQGQITIKAQPPENLKALAETSDPEAYHPGGIGDFEVLEHELCFTFENGKPALSMSDFVTCFSSVNGISLANMHYTSLERKLRLAGVSSTTFSPLNGETIIEHGFAVSFYGSASILNTLSKPAFVGDPLVYHLYSVHESQKYSYHTKELLPGQKSKCAPYLETYDPKITRHNEKILVAHAIANDFHFNDLITASSEGLPYNLDNQIPSETQIAAAHLEKFVCGIAFATLRVLLQRGKIVPLASVDWNTQDSFPVAQFGDAPEALINYEGPFDTQNTNPLETDDISNLKELITVNEALVTEKAELLYAELLGLSLHPRIRNPKDEDITGPIKNMIEKSSTIRKNLMAEVFFEDLHMGKFSFDKKTSEGFDDYLAFSPLIGDILTKLNDGAPPGNINSVIRDSPTTYSMKTNYMRNRRSTSYNLHNLGVFLNQETVGRACATSLGESHDANRKLDVAVNVTNITF